LFKELVAKKIDVKPYKGPSEEGLFVWLKEAIITSSQGVIWEYEPERAASSLPRK
jgi:hypothetical protein